MNHRISKLLALCEGNPSVIGGFPTQRASNAESVSVPWRHCNPKVFMCRWARPDISETSGLAVLEVNIPTGYVITNDVLRLYAQSGTVPTLRRAEQYGRKTVFYFDYVSIAMSVFCKVLLSSWWPLLRLLSRCPIFKSCHCHTFGDGAPVDFSYGFPTLIARFMETTLGPSRADRTQGPVSI